MEARTAIGVDLGGTNIKAALVSEDAGLIHEVRSETGADNGPAFVLDQIGVLVSKLQAYSEGKGRTISGIGIGAPGAVNLDRKTVGYPPNFPDWDVIDVSLELRNRQNRPIPVIVENDANVAALGSAFHGAGASFDSFIMVTLGTGVGGAIIYRKKIFRGTTGAAGEIGRMTIDYEGPMDRTGIAGAVEAYIGQRYLSRYARYRLRNQTDSLIHDMTGPKLKGITPRMLFEAAKSGDREAADILSWAGHKLGCVIGSSIALMDIRKVVVGGGLSAAGDFILNSVRETVRRFVAPSVRDDIEIVQETRGNEVGMLGAARLIFHDIESSPDPSTVNRSTS